MKNRVLRWGIYVLVAIGFAVACAFLSQWQFDRSATRTAQLELIERNYDADPVPLADIIGADGILSAEDTWRPVTLTGEYLADEQLLVRNRPHGGTSAFEVLVPFRDDDGRVLIVDRGWVPPGEGALPDAVPEAPEGDVSVVVRLRPTESLPSSGRSAPDGQVPTIHLPTVAELLPDEEVIASSYGQLVSENPAPDESLGGFSKPTEDPGMNFSYAIQWILFAIMGFVFIAYMIRTEIRAHREDAEGRPTVPKTSRRRDHDMDAEDELLDAR